MKSHNKKNLLFYHPSLFIPDDPAIDSGRLDIKTADRIARLIVPPSSIPNPITIDSAIPSRIMANTMGILCPSTSGRFCSSQFCNQHIAEIKRKSPYEKSISRKSDTFSNFYCTKNKQPKSMFRPPNLIIIPIVFLLKLKVEEINPPKTKEEVASNPHKKAFSIVDVF